MQLPLNLNFEKKLDQKDNFCQTQRRKDDDRVCDFSGQVWMLVNLQFGLDSQAMGLKIK